MEFAGRALGDITRDVFAHMGGAGNQTFRQLADAKGRSGLTDASIIEQLGKCHAQHGFQLRDLLFTRAHADVNCIVRTPDNQIITFSDADKQKCLDVYREMIAKNAPGARDIVKGISITNAFASPLGSYLAIFTNGPVVLGHDDKGEAFGAADAAGRMLYANPLTGQHFFANPNDPGDQAMLETAVGLAGIFSGASAASKVRIGAGKGLAETQKLVARYGPMQEGPLPVSIANTFRSGAYEEIITEIPMTLYRAIGDNGRALGGYWTRNKPTGPLQTVIDSALDQNWGNTATTVIQMRVPSGTRLFQGQAAHQRGLVGGGSQVYFDPRINPINPDWLK